MSKPFEKYNTPAPKINDHNVIDDPLIPKEGIALSQDGLNDSTKLIESNKFIDNTNVWRVDPSQFYENGSGLNGIDINKQIDLGRFNKEFDRTKQIAINNQKLNDLTKLNELSKEEKKEKLYNLNMSEIILNTKDTWFNVLDDLLDQQFKLQTFTKENRLFYIGVTILLFGIIIYLYISLSREE